MAHGLLYGASFTNGALSFTDKQGRTICNADLRNYLTLTATEDNSSVALTKVGTLSYIYEVNTGSGWEGYTFGTVINLNAGQSCKWRCKTHPKWQDESYYVQFVMTGTIEASGNCNSMLSSDFESETSLSGYDYVFYKLFYDCTSLTKAPLLPAKTLEYQCYTSMFSGCTSLTKAPLLPATTIPSNCYTNMFRGCTSLTKAPLLPATTLSTNCYYRMFGGCSSLKEVRISATTTATGALTDWLDGVSATGDFYCDPNATIFPTDSESGIPKGWVRRDINTLRALTLTATEDNSSVRLTKNGTLDNTFEVDKGNGWEDYAFGTVIPLNAGESCRWRCKSHPTTQSNADCVQFVMTGKIEASGNVNSMLSSGFENLTSLSGYNNAFKSLFRDCTSLTQAPKLPATTLATYCYAYMFRDCTSLVQAPELPATTLATYCYFSMFKGCTSLVQAPELPATALAGYCYSSMFYGCRSLKEVRISATTTAPKALDTWLKGVSATGDFYCDPNATIFPTNSISGIPKNWTRHALADYPVTP